MHVQRIRCHSKGYTLIEIMVVIVIIAALTAIAVPIYTKYQIQADTTRFLAHAEGLKNAAVIWQQKKNTNNMDDFNGAAQSFAQTLTANDGSTIDIEVEAGGSWVDIYGPSKMDTSVFFEFTGGMDSDGNWIWACGSDEPFGECTDWDTYCDKLDPTGWC